MIDNTPIPQFRWFTRNPYIHILSIRRTNDMEESRIINIRPFPDRDRSTLSARPDMELNIRKIIYLRPKIRIKTYYWTQCILPNPNTISIILIRIFRPYHIGLIGVRTRITKLIPYVIRQTSFTSSQLMRKE